MQNIYSNYEGSFTCDINCLYHFRYICGPTVYDASHIGHASNYVRYDIIRRIFTNFCDLNVIYLMGITDIDDKIIDKANYVRMFS